MKTSRFFLFIPFFLGVIVYLNTISHGFVYDDSFFHCKKEYNSLTSIPLAFSLPYSACVPGNGIYRPIPTVTVILTQAVFGELAWVLHLENILLHGAISMLIFLVLSKIFSLHQGVSLVVSMLFAVLPIHTETVANIKSRDELLLTFFFLLLWMAYEQGRRNIRWYGVSSIFFTLALFSKESAIVLPVLVATVALIRHPQSWKQVGKSLLWFIPGLGIYFFMRAWANIPSLSSQSDVVFIFNPLVYSSFAVRIFSVLHILVLYIEKTFLPVSLSATYHYAHFVPVTSILKNPIWIFGVMFVVVGIYLCIRHIRKKDAIVLGLLLFGFTYLPFSQVIRPGGDVIAERWMYLPSLGLMMVATQLLFGLLRYKKKYLYIVIGILIAIYGVRTWVRNPVWASNSSLMLSMTIDAPKSVRGHILLADQYLTVDNNTKKEKEELQLAYDIYPNDAQTNTLLAQSALTEGKYEEARKYLSRSSILDPRFILTDRIWAQLYFQENNFKQALFHSQKIINNKIYDWKDVSIYALTLTKLKRYDEAAFWVTRITKGDRTNSDVQFLEALLLYKTGKIDQALHIKWDLSLSVDQRVAILDAF